MNRRDFLKLFGGVAVAGAVPAVLEHPGQDMRREGRVVTPPVIIQFDQRVAPYVYSGAELDRLGRHMVTPAVYRRRGETDHALRQRILAKITRA